MNEIEAALAAWTPCAPKIDRDRLMFAAGEASRSPARCSPVPWAGRSPLRYVWPLATSLSTAAALFLAFLLAQNRANQVPVAGGDAPLPIATAPVPPELPPQRNISPTRWEPPAVAEGTYLALRNQMLTTPADQWPVPMNDDIRGAAAVGDDAARLPPTRRNLLREFLPPDAEPVRRSPTPAPAAQTDQPLEAIS